MQCRSGDTEDLVLTRRFDRYWELKTGAAQHAVDRLKDDLSSDGGLTACFTEEGAC